MQHVWESIYEMQSRTGERPVEIVVTGEEYDILLMDMEGGRDVTESMELFGIPVRVIADTIEEEEGRSRETWDWSGQDRDRSLIDQFTQAMSRLGITAQVLAGRLAGEEEADILSGLVETLQPEWTIEEAVLNGESNYQLICQIGSWSHLINLTRFHPAPAGWEYLQRQTMLAYAGWITERRTPGEFGGLSPTYPPEAYRVDPERVVAPEDIPGVTWRDRERWIRQLDTTPDEYPHDESGGMSSEELMEAIGMAVDDWKKEEK